MLVLSNEEITEILTMDDVIESLEGAYQELGEGRAGNIPRADLLVPAPGKGDVHGFKTMSGSVPKLGVTALRLNSDIIHWPEFYGVKRRVKIPLAPPGGKWVGLVLLFSTATGEPLAIFPDGVVQRMRVAGSSGVAAKFLAREDVKTVGLFGSGWQAGAHVMAMAAVRRVKLFKVFSPNSDNCRKFAKEMSDQLGIEARAVNSPEKAACEVDLLVAATNALGTVIKGDWVRPGTHLTCVRAQEIESSAYDKCDVIFINCRKELPDHYLISLDSKNIPDISEGWENQDVQKKQMNNMPELGELVAGKVKGRTNVDQITCFNNNIGLGIQFAATGAKLLALAKEKGVGRELPIEWLTQNVHP